MQASKWRSNLSNQQREAYICNDNVLLDSNLDTNASVKFGHDPKDENSETWHVFQNASAWVKLWLTQKEWSRVKSACKQNTLEMTTTSSMFFGEIQKLEDLKNLQFLQYLHFWNKIDESNIFKAEL